MMECVVQRERLLESLQSVVGVVEARQTVPILSHVLLEILQDTMTVQCTDNEMTIISHCVLNQAKQLGKATVSAYTLLEIVRRLPHDALILLKQEADQVLVSSGSINFRLMSLPPEEFPSAVHQAGMISISVPEKLLYQAIKTTQFAMAQNNPRYYLNGMLWDIRDGQLELVATDAHRLAQRSIPINSEQVASIIVPRKTIMELGKLLTENSDQDVNIGFTDNQLGIEGASYQLISRLIAGNFPDYKKLLPEVVHRSAIIQRNVLREALSKLAPLLKQEIYKGVRLVFNQDILKLRVSNSKQETGEESIAINYSSNENKSFSIAFNIDYLDKILEVIAVSEVEMLLPEEEGVTLLKQHTEGHLNHVYLIMPMFL